MYNFRQLTRWLLLSRDYIWVVLVIIHSDSGLLSGVLFCMVFGVNYTSLAKSVM